MPIWKMWNHFPPQEEHLHTSMLYSSFIISAALRFSMQKYIFTSKQISTVRHLFALVSARQQTVVPDSDKTFRRNMH